MAFDGTLKFDTKIDTSGFQTGISKLGDFAKAGMAAVTGAITAASGAMAALGKEALNAYADYEQLSGGVETLFGEVSDSIRAVGQQARNEMSDDVWKKLGQQVYDNAAAFKEWENDVGSSMDAVADAMSYGIGTASADAEGYIKYLTDAYQMNADDAQAMADAVSAAISANIDDLGDYAASMEDIPDAAKMVSENANKAFQTAGISANEYMDATIKLSASLIQGLGGDTVQAAMLADMAITDMSDNVNKMGTSMEAVQNAYNGLSRQNFTMLDNLALGYKGTAAEMARLINDSKVMGDSFVATADNVKEISFDKYIEAIHVIQTEMGITGTTAKEASSTIQGSVSAAKAAWKNFLTGTGTARQFAEMISVAVKNIRRSLNDIIPRLSEGLTELVTLLAPEIPPIIEETLPAIIDGASTLITGLARSLPQLLTAILPALSEGVVNVSVALVTVLPELITSLSQSIPIIVRTIMSKKDDLLKAGKDIIAAILPDNPSELMSTAFQIINHFIENLLSDDNINYILEKAPELIHALAKGITDFLFGSDRSAEGGLFGAVYKIVERFCDYFSDAENRANFESAAEDILIELGDFLVENVGLLAKYALKIGQALAEAVITAFLDALIPVFNSEAGWMDEYLNADTNLTYEEWANQRHESDRNQETESHSYVGQSGSYDTSNGMLLADSWDNAAAKEAYKKYRGYASGFVVDRPTWLNPDTVVGENGMEALLPLETNTGWMELLAEKLIERMRIAAETAKAIRTVQSSRAAADAVDLLRSFTEAPQWNIIQPSPTSEITNNYYTSTTNSRTDSEQPVINVYDTIHVEMDGEKVAELTAERVDILQGEAVTMDERGTAH